MMFLREGGTALPPINADISLYAAMNGRTGCAIRKKQMRSLP